MILSGFFVVALGGGLFGVAETIPKVDSSVRYSVRYVDDPAPGWLEVSVRVEGLSSRDRGVRLHLENWGEWLDREGYLEELTAEPPLAGGAPEGEEFRFQLPSDWDGRIELSYRIPVVAYGSPEHRAHGLLPWREGDFVHGFAHNVLPNLVLPNSGGASSLQGRGTTRTVRRWVHLIAPRGGFLASGWTGVAEGETTVELSGPVDQCLMLFGPRPRVARSKARRAKTAVEVIQFGSGKDITESILRQSSAFLAVCEKALGAGIPSPERVFVTGNRPGGGGGVRTDHGIEFEYRDPPDSLHSTHVLAHELFHEWLPGLIEAEGQSLVWFFEGFTEYFSLYFAAKAKLIDWDLFAERILEIDRDARASSAFSEVGFGQEGVSWRDGDGPLETLAYKGGALFAFHLDAELRLRKRIGLSQMLADFLHEKNPGYSLEKLRKWTEKKGVGPACRRALERANSLPETGAVLRALGFLRIPKERETTLTYFGIETDGGGGPGKVLAIDPEGPNHDCGLQVGDWILRGFPMRPYKARAKEGLTTQYSYGLSEFSTVVGGDGWWVEIRRGTEEMRISLEPWGWRGGIETIERADRKKVAKFFEAKD